MNITIELNKNKWLLEINGVYEGLNIKQRIRNKKHISDIVENLESPSSVYIGINDMKLFYNDCTLILKYYRKNCNRYLFKKVTEKIDHNTKITNILSINNDKLRNMAKNKKIVVLGLSLTIASATLSASIPNKVEQPAYVSEVSIQTDNQSDINQVIETTPNIEIVEEEKFNIDDYISLDNRISEIEYITNSDNSSVFNVCSKLSDYTVNRMVSYFEANGQYYINAGKKYGIDPYLLLSFAMTETSLLHEETIPGGKQYNGAAIGAMQIEKVHIGESVTAFNYQSNEYETVQITEEKLVNLSSNIEIGAMMLQNNLERYNNNVYIAIQSHNYGTSAMDLIIETYAKEVGKSFEEVTLDMTDIGWMKYVNDMHNNPKKYISSWKSGTYGNNNYLYSILGYYMGQNIVNNGKDNYYIYDLVSNTCQKEAKETKEIENYVSLKIR